MITITDKTQCTGCAACSQICPKSCIEMKADSEGFLYPSVAEESCVNCGLCEQVCPMKNTEFVPIDGFPDAFLAYDTDDEWRKKSASGGAFAAIARDFIEKYHGAVFGAVYDGSYNVYHTSAESIEGIKRFQKSKYVQSEIRDSYILAKNELKSGRYVLFSGTPCQIYGLKSYLGKLADDEKLYCVDLSCHGVPSPKVLQKYLDYLRRSEQSEIASFTMRDKHFGKNSYSVRFGVSFENGKKYQIKHEDDYFGRCFFGEVASRPSCFDCRFKTVWRAADITLGDCWYFNSFVPSEHDTMGVTLVLSHSEKGKKLLADNKMLCQYSVPSEEIIKVNAGVFKSATLNPRRSEFFERIDNEPFENAVDSVVPKPKSGKKEKLKRIINSRDIRLEFLRKKSREKRIKALLSKTIPDSSLGEMKINYKKVN